MTSLKEEDDLPGLESDDDMPDLESVGSSEVSLARDYSCSARRQSAARQWALSRCSLACSPRWVCHSTLYASTAAVFG